MRGFAVVVVPVTCLLLSVTQSAAEPPLLVACDELPEAVAALGSKSEVEAFAVAPETSVAIAAMPVPGDAARSLLRFSIAGGPPRDVKLAGRVFGLAITADGKQAYAIVRVTERKGAVRSVDLVRCDLESGRASAGPTLPHTARGVAFGSGGSTLLVASRDEIRTFQLPAMSSGPLYRVIGDNVGVAPLPSSSGVYVAQSARIAIADLSATQTRDGLALSQEVAAPAPLTGLMASTGSTGPIAISATGGSWCVRSGALPPPPPPARESPEEPVRGETAPAAIAPASGSEAVPVPPPEEPARDEAAPAVAASASGSEASPLPEELARDEGENPNVTPTETAPAVPAVPPSTVATASAGTVTGGIAGPSLAEVDAIVFFGPDNILREAARVIPDERGRFEAHALLPGSYRIVAAGKRGRVLICDPPFITIRVSSNGAIEAPVLNVIRAQ